MLIANAYFLLEKFVALISVAWFRCCRWKCTIFSWRFSHCYCRQNYTISHMKQPRPLASISSSLLTSISRGHARGEQLLVTIAAWHPSPSCWLSYRVMMYSWRSITLSLRKKLTSSTANLEWCHVHFSKIQLLNPWNLTMQSEDTSLIIYIHVIWYIFIPWKLEVTWVTRTPAFWDTPGCPMITHTRDSYQIQSENKTKSKLQILKNCQKF